MSSIAEKLFPAPIPVATALRRRASPSIPITPAASSAHKEGFRPWWLGLLAASAWSTLGALTYLWPNKEVGFSDWAYTTEFAWFALAVAGLLAVLALVPKLAGPLLPRLQLVGPWLLASAVGLAAWEVFTAKLGTLPTPFFAPPQSLAEVFISDWERLIDCAVNSVKLLLIGIGMGGVAGFVVGVLIGWSKLANYWIHPVLRVLGPLPTTALLPISFYFFPSSWSTAVFLIALGTAFPVAILTWSGVSSVNKNYYDVARTMGASPWFLVLRVAIPASLPQVFVGLFMGLGAAFSTLVVAEMLGVKSGLGWYLTWAQGWASYPNMYGALLVMALLFSGVISLLFLVRDRVLSWQKGMVKS
ncbi:MAG: ABC transporter permease subunit [Giesbergeria sp.]|uniref:ABC transporter permease n=1 Tax=Giesbergeria sp. TaxID=2818473 RepID=UPI00262412BF|nr:ABC transporter permease subunit [Giesbergeria sp.]MDD2611087.1 ABC transporter permease subunit [Giesbergeria sp.]